MLPEARGSAAFSLRSSTTPSASRLSAIARLCAVASGTLRMSVLSVALEPVSMGLKLTPIHEVIMVLSEPQAILIASVTISRIARRMTLRFFMELPSLHQIVVSLDKKPCSMIISTQCRYCNRQMNLQ